MDNILQFDLRLENDIPDIIFPTDNEWGIPLLDYHKQADFLVMPFMCWGSCKRSTDLNGGTYHFYVDDYRFNALWKYPQAVYYSRCGYAVEPNYTVSLTSPLAYVEWCVYRKRWLARFWQSKGIRIWVDLNIPTEFQHLTFAGVPREWRAFMTRGYEERFEATSLEYQSAIKHHGSDDILFVVYGGGKRVKEDCRRNGWQWIPEHRDIIKGRYSADGKD